MDKIKIFCCRYVCGYEDGMALSSSEHIFRTKKERMDFVKDYDPDEIDIDTNEHEYGWEFSEDVI